MIQSAINRTLGTTAAAASLYRSQANAKMREMQKVRLQQQKEFDKLKESVKSKYGFLGGFSTSAQMSYIQQDPTLQKQLKRSKELEDKLNG